MLITHSFYHAVPAVAVVVVVSGNNDDDISFFLSRVRDIIVDDYTGCNSQ